MISKSCKYAIRASIYIASRINEGVNLGVKEIASEIEAPEAFTAKILQALNKHRIITSQKGPYGGFFTEKHQLDLPLIDIVNAIDGLAEFSECGLGLHKCSDQHPCPMHFKYSKSRDYLKNSFQQTTIGKLSRDLSEGIVFVNNTKDLTAF